MCQTTCTQDVNGLEIYSCISYSIFVNIIWGMGAFHSLSQIRAIIPALPETWHIVSNQFLPWKVGLFGTQKMPLLDQAAELIGGRIEMIECQDLWMLKKYCDAECRTERRIDVFSNLTHSCLKPVSASVVWRETFQNNVEIQHKTCTCKFKTCTIFDGEVFVGYQFIQLTLLATDLATSNFYISWTKELVPNYSYYTSMLITLLSFWLPWTLKLGHYLSEVSDVFCIFPSNIFLMMLLLNRYRWTWIWQTQWDQENWSVVCKICRIYMTNTWYALAWDQAYRPSYAKICRTVVRHIQVHLYHQIIRLLLGPRGVDVLTYISHSYQLSFTCHYLK